MLKTVPAYQLELMLWISSMFLEESLINTLSMTRFVPRFKNPQFAKLAHILLCIFRFSHYTCLLSPAIPWCSPAGCWAPRIVHLLSPCAVSWKKPWRTCQTPRTLTRSCTSTWMSPQWSLGPLEVGIPLGGRLLCAWRAWTLWPQWRSTTPTATSSVPNMRQTEPSLTPWRAWTCQCRLPQPRCLYSRPATPPPTPLRLPHQLWSWWRIGKRPEKCPGSDGFTLNRLVTAIVCHPFSPVHDRDTASCYWL